MSNYLGSDWIEKSFNICMSELGREVADLLGDVYLGIYHLDYNSLKKVDWSNDYWIRIVLRDEMSTYDNSVLTRFIVLAHDRMIRISMRGVGSGYMEMLFHKRKRNGSIGERHPTLEDHAKLIRDHYKNI